MVLNVSPITSKELYILINYRFYFFLSQEHIFWEKVCMLKLNPIYLVLVSLTPRMLALHGLYLLADTKV